MPKTRGRGEIVRSRSPICIWQHMICLIGLMGIYSAVEEEFVLKAEVEVREESE